MSGQHLFAFGLRQAAPHAVRLAGGQGVTQAFADHRAPSAHRLGGCLPGGTSRATFALGVEEQAAVNVPARAVELPVPHICDGTGKPADICHLLGTPSVIGPMGSRERGGSSTVITASYEVETVRLKVAQDQFAGPAWCSDDVDMAGVVVLGDASIDGTADDGQ